MTNLTIVKVLEYYGGEIPNGNENHWLSLRCPFHNDHVKSGSVWISEGIYKCHACNVFGDVLNVIARQEGFGTLEYPDRRKANEWAKQVLGQSYKAIPRTTKKRKSRKNDAWRERLSP